VGLLPLSRNQQSQTGNTARQSNASRLNAIQMVSQGVSQVFQPKSVALVFNLNNLPLYLHYLLVPIVVILWVMGLKQTDLAQLNDLGLVSVLPLFSYAVLITLTLSFIAALQSDNLRVSLLALHILALIFMLYAISPVMEDVPNFSVNWRHVGIIDYITNNGNVDPKIDAYFNWPAFFIANSFMTQLAGLQSSLTFVPWSSFYFNLLYLLPLYQIFKVALADKRAIWFGIWMFYIGNWIGQDYFSPQALNYFFYLVLIAVLLTYFKKSGISIRNFGQADGLLSRAIKMVNGFFALPSTTQNEANPIQQIGLLLIIIVIFSASAMGHQLTPFAILFAVTILVFFNYISLRNLPIIMGIIVATWISYMAVAYMQGHIEKILSEIGRMSSSLDENVTARISGSADHKTITSFRMYMSLGVWGLAFLGGLWRMFRKQHVVVWAALAGIAFALIGLQDYGGEMILRVYLLSLPFMLVFVVSLFLPTPIFRYKWLTTIAMTAVMSVIIMGFLFSRYGNQRMDYKTQAEIEGLRTLYDFAEPGSLLLAARPNLAWRFEDYNTYKHRLVDDEFAAGDIEGIVQQMKYWEAPSYLVLTRSQQVSAEMFLDYTEADWANFEHNLIEAGLTVYYENADTSVYMLANRATRPPIPVEQPELKVWETRYHPLLTIAVLVFLLVVPGKAIVRRLKLNDVVIEWMLSIALSVSLLTITSTALIALQIWHIEYGLGILVFITYVAIAFPSLERVRGFVANYQKLQELSPA
jgi:hypothetical protein